MYVTHILLKCSSVVIWNGFFLSRKYNFSLNYVDLVNSFRKYQGLMQSELSEIIMPWHDICNIY